MMKQPDRIFRFFIFLVGMVFILNGCMAPAGNDRDLVPVLTNTPTSYSNIAAQTELSPSMDLTTDNDQEILGEENTPSPQPGDTDETPTEPIIPTLKPTKAGTPTPDLRLPPEAWQNWSVIPEVSGTAMDIYQRGIAMGNDPKAFSKVGDCQAIKEVLMGIYDLPGRYFLTDNDRYLQETIDNFAGSFNRDGMAVKGGFNAAAVLSPIWADPDDCLAGETPLECEFRVHNPSIVIISLEVWWEGRTVERYETYMRMIIEKAIEEGIVPVLSTKADNVEGDHSINAATVRLAYEYDIPLWNFWSAVQKLPNQGIDPDRDGFHISTQAWDVRSYTALQTIDAIWRASRETPVEEVSTATPEVGSTQVSQNVPTIIPYTLSGEALSLTTSERSGSIYFGLAERQEETFTYLGVYSLNLESLQMNQVAQAGTTLQGVSPDGRYLLVNQDSVLLLLDLQSNESEQITTEFYSLGKIGAVWLADNSGFAYIHLSTFGNSLRIRLLDKNEERVIQPEGANPIQLYPVESGGLIIWEDGSCASDDVCELNGAWRSSLSDGRSSFWGKYEQLAFAQGSPLFAFQVIPSEKLMISINHLDDGFMREVQFGGDNLIDMQWSPMENRIAVLTLVRSAYSGKSGAVRVFSLDTTTWSMRELSSLSGLNSRVLWSPDGRSLLITSTELEESGIYRLHFRFKDGETDQTIDLADQLNLTSDQFIISTNIFWTNQ